MIGERFLLKKKEEGRRRKKNAISNRLIPSTRAHINI